MKNVLVIIAMALLVISCEPCDNCEQCDEVDDTFLVDAILDGDVVTIDDKDNEQAVQVNGAFSGILSKDVAVKRYAVITCNLFGYPEICSMTGTKGRALGKSSGSPTEDDITTYREAGSEADPGDLSGMTLYSNVWYPNDDDTNANPNALRGKVAAWGAGWNNARVDFCDIGNPKGTHVHCVQE